MGKNKKIQTLNKKKDFDLLKRKASISSYQWLKVFFFNQTEESLKVAWSLSKKNVFFSVERNRLKRWGRENLKKTSAKGLFLFVFLARNKGFYKKLKRKEFDDVFTKLMEKIQTKN